MADGMQEKSLATVISDLKLELFDFFQTRSQMLISEMKTNLALLRMATPTLAVAAVFCVIAFNLLSLALVALIAVGLGADTTAWIEALAIVGGSYFVIGGIAWMFGWRKIINPGLAPTRTMRVLKQDQVWLRNEARTQL